MNTLKAAKDALQSWLSHVHFSLKFTIQGTLRFDEGLLHQQQNGIQDMISENANSALKTVYKYM